MDKMQITVALAAALLVIGIYFLVGIKPTSLFTPLVSGCAETDSGQAARASGDWTAQAPKIEVAGNSIIYSRAISHMCCRKTEMLDYVNGSEITIYENWSGDGCRCLCYSNLGAKLENVPAGNYFVSVYESGTDANGSVMENKLITNQSARIG